MGYENWALILIKYLETVHKLLSYKVLRDMENEHSALILFLDKVPRYC